MLQEELVSLFYSYEWVERFSLFIIGSVKSS